MLQFLWDAQIIYRTLRVYLQLNPARFSIALCTWGEKEEAINNKWVVRDCRDWESGEMWFDTNRIMLQSLRSQVY